MSNRARRCGDARIRDEPLKAACTLSQAPNGLRIIDQAMRAHGQHIVDVPREVSDVGVG